MAQPLRSWIRPFALVLLLFAAACGSDDSGSQQPAGRDVSIERVRMLVTQVSQGGDIADDAEEELGWMGMKAKPALLRILRDDPTLTADELDAMINIVDGYAPDPELWAALRTRVNDIPDPELRRLRLRTLDALQAS